MPNYLHGIEVVEIDDGIRPIQTVRSSIIGLIGGAASADAAKFPLDTPVLVTGPRQAAALGADGTLLDAYRAIYAQGAAVVVVVRIDDTTDALAAAVGDPIAFTGINAFLRAQALTGVAPRILVAPGLTGTRPAASANPLVTAALPVLQRLRAIIVADGPNTDTADALIYAADWGGTDRVYVVDPAVRVYDPVAAALVTRPASGYAAGLIAATDIKHGVWWSPSNQVVAGVSGTARPIGYVQSASESEHNLLNEAKVATFIQPSSWRLFGNRVTATDTLWTFLSVRRTADIIYDSIDAALLWALDRPATPQLVVDVRDTVQTYLDNLVGIGALLGGRVWFDPELNPVTALQSGQLTLDFDIEPPAPIERITFRAHRNGDYYETLALALSDTSV
jgi:hypothetical protein